jgi:hypothetical protein
MTSKRAKGEGGNTTERDPSGINYSILFLRLNTLSHDCRAELLRAIFEAPFIGGPLHFVWPAITEREYEFF